ncbi:MAG: M28 family peptidase [Planctomycetes bacterium]|nr:M28 family peptidase [Planctomycetota bacterium]
MKNIFSLAAAFLFYILFCSSGNSFSISTDPEPSTLSREEALSTITSQEFKDHLDFLASDEMKGRNTPSPELNKAADYIGAEFKRCGLLSPEGIENYIQWWEFGKEKAPNCIGYIPGTDPVLKDEYVVIGAHMDHVGAAMGQIHNGADDNASGTTGILELAEAFSSLKEKPKRSMVFMTFGGEEKGLLGSRHYVQNPVFPLDKTVAMINLDMIGRSEKNYLFIGGVETADKWEELIDGLKDKYNFDLETAPGGVAPSDNTNFFRKGIPVLFFFTNVHEDYHGPGDDPDKINFETAHNIAKLVFEVAYEVSFTDIKLEFKKIEQPALPSNFNQKMMERFGGMPNQKRLGIFPAEEVDETELKSLNLEEGCSAIKVDQVEKGSVAKKCGVKSGDFIVKFNGTSLSSDDPLRHLTKMIRKVEENKEIPITIIRDGQEMTLTAIWKSKEDKKKDNKF